MFELRRMRKLQPERTVIDEMIEQKSRSLAGDFAVEEEGGANWALLGRRHRKMRTVQIWKSQLTTAVEEKIIFFATS